MIIPWFKIKKTKNRGWGVFASRFIPKGTITCFECKKCRIYKSIKQLNKLPKYSSEHILGHGFERKEGDFLMPCDETIYLNHSCDANTLTDPKTNLDIVIKDIKKGEELTYDYRMFFQGKFKQNYYYTNMKCKCGEKNCQKIINPKHPPLKIIENFWNNRIKSALKLINKVPQPLKKQIIRDYPKHKKLFL